jgi:hypothetical protein
LYILRLRNPLGNSVSWTGKYGPGSEEWNKIDETILKKLNVIDQKNGHFYIDFDDFFRFFDAFHICWVGLDGLFGKSSWIVENKQGEFLPGVNSGGWYYYIFLD